MGFDLQKETPFWYVIKDGPFVFDELDAKYRRSVRKSLERCEVKMIDPTQFTDAIWDVNQAAYSKYHNADNEQTRDLFDEELKSNECEYWAAFDKESNRLVGWISCLNYDEYAETRKAKYHPDYQNLRPSDALHYTVLNYYLNQLGKRYVLSGARNLNHKTNVQDYEIKNWKYRRAYCYLEVMYKPVVRMAVNMLYLIRKPLRYLDGISIIHLINSLLLQETVVRECKRLRNDDS